MIKARQSGALSTILVLVLRASVLPFVSSQQQQQIHDDTAHNHHASSFHRQQQSNRRALLENQRYLAMKINCGVTNPSKRIVVRPTWTASYPGSGAMLTWKLIQSITGIYTGDNYDANDLVRKGTAAAVKTHYPSHTPEVIFSAPQFEKIDRAILLLRNPLTSIPSFHNFLYEQENDLRNHSSRAPIEFWIMWRDQFFGKELKAWVDHAQWWIDNYDPGSALEIISFEHLTGEFGEQEGIHTLKSMSDFLAVGDQGIADNMVKSEDMDCIWHQYVKKSSVPGEDETRKSHREGGPTEYPYTFENLNQMVDSLTKLQEANHSKKVFRDIIMEYIDVIEKKKQQVQLMA